MAEGAQQQQQQQQHLLPGVGPAPRGVKREPELEQPMPGGGGDGAAESGQSKRLRTEAEADGGGMQPCLKPLRAELEGSASYGLLQLSTTMANV
ncbi:hypothetical protein lerEdw1_019580 [Lerista edwardsae]|nr:hypothetical protein lerEdw1_019580 [Lerista edwardsae]